MAHATEAVRGLKEWQRDRGHRQEQALRELQRSLTRLERAEWERSTAETGRDRALQDLARSGISAADVAGFLGIEPTVLAPGRRSKPAG